MSIELHPRMEGNIGPDGNAIFVRRDRFEILKQGSEVLKTDDGTL